MILQFLRLLIHATHFDLIADKYQQVLMWIFDRSGLL